MISALSDSELLVEYASHFSETAFSELHSRYDETVRRFVEVAFRLDFNDACDVMQATWIAIAEAARTPIQNFAGWVRMIAANQARKFLNESNHRTAVESPLSGTEADSDAPNPIDDMIYCEDQAAIAERMRALGDDRRQAILMIYSEGRTFAEVGERLGIAPQTLWDRVSEDYRKLLSA